jgi:hypothetical protein
MTSKTPLIRINAILSTPIELIARIIGRLVLSETEREAAECDAWCIFAVDKATNDKLATR